MNGPEKNTQCYINNLIVPFLFEQNTFSMSFTLVWGYYCCWLYILLRLHCYYNISNIPLQLQLQLCILSWRARRMAQKICADLRAKIQPSQLILRSSYCRAGEPRTWRADSCIIWCFSDPNTHQLIARHRWKLQIHQTVTKHLTPPEQRLLTHSTLKVRESLFRTLHHIPIHVPPLILLC